MGVWIVIAIVLFVYGSMMALKPSGIDQRLDKLRMTARRLQLNPKLVACPDWIRGKDNEYGRGMLGQYGLVLDNIQLPHIRYRVIDGQWRPDDSIKPNIDSSYAPKASFSLDKVPLALPATIEPFVKALLIKANSVVIYWEDIAYVRPLTNPGYKSSAIETDLLALKAQLAEWALSMQNSPRNYTDSSGAHNEAASTNNSHTNNSTANYNTGVSSRMLNRSL